MIETCMHCGDACGDACDDARTLHVGVLPRDSTSACFVMARTCATVTACIVRALAWMYAACGYAVGSSGARSRCWCDLACSRDRHQRLCSHARTVSPGSHPSFLPRTQRLPARRVQMWVRRMLLALRSAQAAQQPERHRHLQRALLRARRAGINASHIPSSTTLSKAGLGTLSLTLVLAHHPTLAPRCRPPPSCVPGHHQPTSSLHGSAARRAVGSRVQTGPAAHTIVHISSQPACRTSCL